MWLSNKLKEWKKKQQERTLEKDKKAIEASEKSLKMWKSAQKVEEARLEVAKEKAKVMKLSSKGKSLKYGKVLKVLKGIGEELSKGAGNVGENIAREQKGRKKKRKAKPDDFFHFGY